MLIVQCSIMEHMKDKRRKQYKHFVAFHEKLIRSSAMCGCGTAAQEADINDILTVESAEHLPFSCYPVL